MIGTQDVCVVNAKYAYLVAATFRTVGEPSDEGILRVLMGTGNDGSVDGTMMIVAREAQGR